MITTKEIIRILEHEEIPDGERDNLEALLQDRAEEALSHYKKRVIVKLVTEVSDLVDSIDLSEKMRDTGSDNMDTLITDIVHEKIEELAGANGWSEIDIEDC